MSLERDDSVDLNLARVVRLGGRDLYIAPLSLRDILAVADELPKVKDITAENVTGERLAPLGEIVWHGLRRAYPRLTRDEFFDLPVTLAELMAAFPVVMAQAGGRKPIARARWGLRAIRPNRLARPRCRPRDRTRLDSEPSPRPDRYSVPRRTAPRLARLATAPEACRGLSGPQAQRETLEEPPGAIGDVPKRHDPVKRDG